VLWSVLVALQIGMVPSMRYAWAFSLWQYLPTTIGAALAVASLAICWRRTRTLLIDRLGRVRLPHAMCGRPLPVAIALTALVTLLWLCRERTIVGDSAIFLGAFSLGWAFVFPDIGATALMALASRLAMPFGFGVLTGVQMVTCLAGAVVVYCLARAAHELTNDGGTAVEIVAVVLIVSGGMLRIFAGHVEAYGPALAAAALYLWLSLACLAGRCGATVPSLALGLVILMHLSAVCLLPSLILLRRWRTSTRGGLRLLRATASSMALAAIPLLLFAGGVALAGGGDDLARAWGRAMHILGIDPQPTELTRQWSVRGWGGAPAAGATD